MRIALATHNPGKADELMRLLKVDGVEFFSLLDADKKVEDVEETENSYRGNALLKSRHVSKTLGLPAIADDSGMELRALGGYPGIKSARCAGENASDNDKLEHILEKMNGVEDRYVEFVCCLALTFPRGEGLTAVFEGRCAGVLAEKIRGGVNTGVQYDSIFIVTEYDSRTFAELPQIVKDDISHRAEACRKMKSYLNIVKQWKNKTTAK